MCSTVEDIIRDATANDISKLIKIMADQLCKTFKGEPSVFSGIWSSGDNLLSKNLSHEEVKVILAGLVSRSCNVGMVYYYDTHLMATKILAELVSQFYDMLMVYYDTYSMATQIANDGERNAKRHAFWQISLAQKFGLDFAKKLGDAHEKGRPGTAEDNRVDDLNNAAALKYAAEHPGVDPRQAADTMWSEGLIVGYQPDVPPEHTKDEV